MERECFGKSQESLPENHSLKRELFECFVLNSAVGESVPSISDECCAVRRIQNREKGDSIHRGQKTNCMWL